MESKKRDEFSLLYDEHVVKIYRFAYLKLGSPDTAEDITAEAFSRVWKDFQRKDIRNIRAFLYGIARNLIADHYRRLSRVKTTSLELEEEMVDESQGSMRERVEIASDMEVVRKALSEIKDEYQDLVIWRYLDELSFPEIAEITGKTEENVRVSLHRAMQALRERLPEGSEL